MIKKAVNCIPLGMRTVKTGLAVLICLFIYMFTNRAGLTSQFDAFLACVSAIICMQDSVGKSVSSGLSRIYGTVVGAIAGMLLLYSDILLQNQYLRIILIALGVIILIVLCNALSIQNSIAITCVVFLVIVLQQNPEGPFIHSVRRLIDTLVGIVVAIVINHFIHNPDNRACTPQEDAGAGGDDDSTH